MNNARSELNVTELYVYTSCIAPIQEYTIPYISIYLAEIDTSPLDEEK